MPLPNGVGLSEGMAVGVGVSAEVGGDVEMELKEDVENFVDVSETPIEVGGMTNIGVVWTAIFVGCGLEIEEMLVQARIMNRVKPKRGNNIFFLIIS
jgi:hypothetical protein